MKKIKFFVFVMLVIIYTTFSYIKINGSTKLFKWENTNIEVPLYAALDNYSSLVKSELYVDGVLSDMEVSATPDMYELSYVDTSHVGIYQVHYGAVCDDQRISVNCGRICIVTFRVVDKIAPIISASTTNIHIPILDDTSQKQKIDYLSYVSVSDNYDSLESIVIKVDDSAVNYFLVGEYDVYISASDSSNNSSNIVLKVFIDGETTPPVLHFLVDSLTFYVDHRPMDINFFDYVYAVDNKSKSENIKISYTSQICYSKVGEYYITYYAVDETGNMSSKKLLVNIVADNTPPKVSIGTHKFSFEQGYKITKADFLEYILYSDNLTDKDKIKVTLELENFSFNVGDYKAVLSFFDEYNNVRVVTLNYSITPDITPPKIKVLNSDFNFYRKESILYSELCTVEDNFSPLSKIKMNTDLSNYKYDTYGSYIIIITAKDESNNTSSAEVVVNVTMSIYNPYISFKLDGLSTLIKHKFDINYLKSIAEVKDLNPSSDVGNLEVDVSQIDYDNPGDYYVLYSIKVDDKKLQKLLPVKVLKDEVAPVIKPLFEDNLSFSYSQKDINKEILKNFTINDNVSKTDKIKVNLVGVLNEKICGFYKVRLIAVDEYTNTATYDFSVEIYDKTPPIISLLDGVTLNIEKSNKFNLLDYFSAFDECDGDISYLIELNNDFNPETVGVQRLSLSVRDKSQNLCLQEYKITVVDTVSPLITLEYSELSYLYTTTFDKKLFLSNLKSLEDNGIPIDKTQVKIDYSRVKNYIGDYEVRYSFSDQSANECVQNLIVHVYTNTPPKLEISPANINVYDAFDFRDYVSVVDQAEEDIADYLKVLNLEDLDVSSPGVYKLVVVCTNKSGLSTSGNLIVVVSNNSEDYSLNNRVVPENNKHQNTILQFFINNIVLFIILIAIALYYLIKFIRNRLINKRNSDSI